MPLQELERLVGREVPLDVLHGELRRSVQAVSDVSEYGAMLVTCSDEYQGELRRNFDRDVARALMPHHPNRIFSASNMGGRVEPGALVLADAHFTVKSRKAGSKLLLVVIASHVGRRPGPDGPVYGELSRFGMASPCCGALAMLLHPPAAASGVRHPWFDQLSAFFGERRLQELRTMPAAGRMVSAAVVHAVLQAESALSDLLREPPPTSTHVVLVPYVIVNQRGSDGALLAGYHHLVCEGGSVHFEQGGSLRSTPSSHEIDASSGRLTIDSPWDVDADEPRPAQVSAPELPADLDPTPAVAQEASEAVEARVERVRASVERMRGRPNAWRVYSRPVLRGLIQALSVVAPEVGLVALLAGGASELAHARHARRILQSGPSTEEARRALHDLEPELQQLGHREAQEVLEALLARYGRTAS